jgi:putative DNA primase/helicase
MGDDHVVELAVQGCVGFSNMWEGSAPYKGMTSGWFSDPHKMASLAVDLDMGWNSRQGGVKHPAGVYITMNPTDPALLARAFNRLKPGVDRTRDLDIAAYHNIFVDLDAKRPAGVSASDMEKKAALSVAVGIREFTRNYLLWPEPMLADSGNGYHLVYKGYFEASPENTEMLKAFLGLLQDLFCIEPQFLEGKQIQINVDSTVFNPSRLIKLHGTTARKGDPTEIRPHRPSYILEIPEPNLQASQGAVTAVMLASAVEYMAASLGKEDELAPVQSLKAENKNQIPGIIRKPGVDEMFTSIEGIEPIMQGGTLDVQKYLNDNGVKVQEIVDGPGDGVKMYVLERCLFDPSHTGKDAAIGQGQDGKLFYKCVHDSCSTNPDRRWAAARKIISGDAGLGQWMSGGSFGVSFPDVNKEGKPYARYSNFKALLKAYGISIRFNEMKRCLESQMPGGLWADSDRKLALTRAAAVDYCVKHGLAFGQLDNWLNLESEDSKYHPVKAWIQSTPWDGVGRLEQLADTVQVPDDQYHLWRLYLRKWLIQGIAALYNADFSGKGVLTFTGAQNVGKTSWLRRLAPDIPGAFAEGVHLDPSNKDSVMYAVSSWLVELGELDATFKKADVSRLKAFISNTSDKIRPPYGKDVEDWRRQTIFAATVNDPQFLVDQTGNSRWWIVESKYINWRHDIDVQQVWAQAFQLYLDSESWHLTPDESDTQAEHNSQYEVVDPIEEKIRESFKFDTMRASWLNPMTTTQVLEFCGYRQPSRSDTTKAGNILVRLTGKAERKAVKGHRGSYYPMPEERSPFEADNNSSNEGGNAVILPFNDPTQGRA